MLSVVTGSSSVSHILVNRLPNSKFDLGDGQEFSTLSHLIDHYTAFPIMVKDGDLVRLKQVSYPFTAYLFWFMYVLIYCGNVRSRIWPWIPFQKPVEIVFFLVQPFNVTRLNVSCLDQRIAQLEKEGARGKRVTGFWEEFEELHDEPSVAGVARSRNEGGRSCNASKNRYKNILPFDATRVILLDGDPSIPGSDYINANYISNPVSASLID